MGTLRSIILTWITLSLTISIASSQSNDAKQTQPISNIPENDQFPNRTDHWNKNPIQFHGTKLELAPGMVLAGVFCFIAASMSSAGGIGGGGLFIPILTIVAGLDLKTASSFSAFMVTGGSIGNVICHLFTTIAKHGGKTLVDYDIALLSEPCMLLGVSVGVICNLVFPEWLITVWFAVFLAWSTFKTCKTGFFCWKLESEEARRNGCGSMENGLVITDGPGDESEVLESTKEPLLLGEVNRKVAFPWMKLGVLLLVWFSFSFLYLLRGNRYGKGIIPMEQCGIGYWLISSLQIPLAIIFTAWILLREKNGRNQTTNQQDRRDLTSCGAPNKLLFPVMAVLAGILGGVFGVGGGMLISPLLLQVGIAPEVTAATCSFMVFFSSTMSAFQYLLVGMEHTQTAIVFALICFIGSLLGLLVVQKAIQDYGRASLIVFSVSIVMALSTVLITSTGTFDVWKDFKSGANMGFKKPC